MVAGKMGKLEKPVARVQDSRVQESQVEIA